MVDFHKYTPLAKGKTWNAKMLPEGVQNIHTGFIPRKLQQYLHEQLRRFNVLVCHRRFGKTVFAINELIHQGMKNKNHKPQYAYIAPTYKQAKMIAWEFLKDFTSKLGSFVEVNKSELSVTIHRPEEKDKFGSIIKERDFIKFILLGADNPDTLRGLYLDGCILDEYAQCDPSIWGEVVRPALSDRKGWAIFIGTPKGQNHFYSRLKKAEGQDSWFTAIFKASETGILDDEELQEMKADMEPEEYEQELECSFTAAIRGAYYGDLIAQSRILGRIGKYPWVPAYPVSTFWDIGVDDHCALVFRQWIDGKWRYIDYYENSNKGVGHYIKILREKPYIYARHIWPHDGVQREFTSGETRVATARKLGLKHVSIQPRTNLSDGIQASRNRIEEACFDEEKCGRLIECLMNYQRLWDKKELKFKETPKKDWATHGSDAFRYSALDDRKDSFREALTGGLPQYANMQYNGLKR